MGELSLKNREEFYCKLEILINTVDSDPAISWTMKQEKQAVHFSLGVQL